MIFKVLLLLEKSIRRWERINVSDLSAVSCAILRSVGLLLSCSAARQMIWVEVALVAAVRVSVLLDLVKHLGALGLTGGSYRGRFRHRGEVRYIWRLVLISATFAGSGMFTGLVLLLEHLLLLLLMRQ